MATKDPDLGEPSELEPGVTSFLRGLAENLEEEEKAPPPEPPINELCKWVTWKAKLVKTPDWWRELLAVPGVLNCKKLVQKVWASFRHPKRISEVNKTENYHQAPMPHHVSPGRISSCLPTHSLLAEILGRCRVKRWWSMPMSSSIGQRRLICLLVSSPASLLRV